MPTREHGHEKTCSCSRVNLSDTVEEYSSRQRGCPWQDNIRAVRPVALPGNTSIRPARRRGDSRHGHMRYDCPLPCHACRRQVSARQQRPPEQPVMCQMTSCSGGRCKHDARPSRSLTPGRPLMSARLGEASTHKLSRAARGQDGPSQGRRRCANTTINEHVRVHASTLPTSAFRKAVQCGSTPRQ